MKYRGHQYTKQAVALPVTQTVEAGKYRGADAKYVELRAVVPHAPGRHVYRGVSF